MNDPKVEKIDTATFYVVVADWAGSGAPVFARKSHRCGWHWETGFRAAHLFRDEAEAVKAARYITRNESESYSPVRRVRAVKLERLFASTLLWTKTTDVVEKIAAILPDGGAS